MMSRYFWAALCCAGIVALNFGVIGCSLGPSKMSALLELEAYDDERQGAGKNQGKALIESLLDGSVFFGCALGAALISFLSKYGRRKCMIFINILSVAGCFGASLGLHWGLFMISRMISGISVGMSGVAALYLSEICLRSKRGMYGALYSVFVTFGELIIIVFQLAHGETLDNSGKCRCHFDDKVVFKDKMIWRISQAAGGIFSLIALYLLFTVVKDDSPFILAKSGRVEDARRVIGLLQGKANVEKAFTEVMEDVANHGSGLTGKVSLFQAFKEPDSRYALLVTFGIAVLRQLCGIYVFTLSASELFGQIVGKGFKAAAWGILCPLVNFIVCCTMPLYVEKLGRRTLLMCGSGIGFLVMAIALSCQNGGEKKDEKKDECCCCCKKKDGKCCCCGNDGAGCCNDCGCTKEGKCCCCCKKDGGTCCQQCTGKCTECSQKGASCDLVTNSSAATWQQYVMIIACVVFVGCFSTGYGGVAWLYFGEALPPEYKDSAFAVASVINWFTCAIVVSTAGPLRKILKEKVYWVYVLFSGVGCLFALIFVRETSGIPIGQAFKGVTGPDFFKKLAAYMKKGKAVTVTTEVVKNIREEADADVPLISDWKKLMNIWASDEAAGVVETTS
ncbi:hexose transporter [Babesia ovis]|uniref:Hexose transporter n=1 Tax=Babesia ovis TaxID=5869 RepID=A0A9W5TDA8_BABOV|nr:hexose transporter [Babesia ovis]